MIKPLRRQGGVSLVNIREACGFEDRVEASSALMTLSVNQCARLPNTNMAIKLIKACKEFHGGGHADV